MAHVLAVSHLLSGGSSRVYNLGSEQGFSVREVINQAKSITGIDFTVREIARRSGDPAVLVASSEKIRTELGWMPRYSNLDSILKLKYTFLATKLFLRSRLLKLIPDKQYTHRTPP